jgi:hypothetical protein
VDYILAMQQLISAPYIRDNISSPVSYMKTVAGRIREHIKAIILWLYTIIYIDWILLPFLTPFSFD